MVMRPDKFTGSDLTPKDQAAEKLRDAAITYADSIQYASSYQEEAERALRHAAHVYSAAAKKASKR